MRGSYQQAVRAANVIELFTPQGLGLYNNDSDPCAGATPGRSLADCARTGVTAAQYGHIIDSAAGQYNAIFGGNPDLQPETAKSRTLGLVLEPTRDLSFTFDYFRHQGRRRDRQRPRDDHPEPVPGHRRLDFCGLIQRDQLGTLWATHAGADHRDQPEPGEAQDLRPRLDGQLQPQARRPSATSNLNFVGTYLKEFVTEPIPGLGEYDCVGLFGADLRHAAAGMAPQAARDLEHPVERRPGPHLALTSTR